MITIFQFKLRNTLWTHASDTGIDLKRRFDSYAEGLIEMERFHSVTVQGRYEPDIGK